MGRVLATVKIFPSDANTDLEPLKERIGEHLPEGTSIYKFDEEPIAFGLVAVIAHILMPEEESGKMEQVEQALKSIRGVSEIQVAMVRRV